MMKGSALTPALSRCAGEGEVVVATIQTVPSPVYGRGLG